jgi:hypothetical protein
MNILCVSFMEIVTFKRSQDPQDPAGVSFLDGTRFRKRNHVRFVD